MTRWIIAIFAMALLILGGYKGYQWWSEEAGSAVVQADEKAQEAPEPAQVASSVVLEAPSKPTLVTPKPNAESDLHAPAVAGDNIINKCVVNDQITYTNDPCPEGSTAAAIVATIDSTAVDPNGVTGSTGDKAPSAAEPTLAVNDPSQKTAECHYLVAEIERMGYEFQQTLPPPVLDQLATKLKNAREQGAKLKCEGMPKEPVAPKSAAPATKMLEEKAS